MKNIKVIGLDLLIVMIIIFFYSDNISREYLGTEYNTLKVFSFLVISMFLSIIAYFLSLLINYLKKTLSFVKILYTIKFLLAFIYFSFFFIKSNYENKIIDTLFMVCSLLVGGILQIFSAYFLEIKLLFVKIFAYLEKIWND